MRSRYTAYTMENEAYLLNSWHSSTRPPSIMAENEPPTKWVELSVMHAVKPGSTDITATVEFTARYKLNGKAEQMHEVSEFVKEGDRWFYLKGQVS